MDIGNQGCAICSLTGIELKPRKVWDDGSSNPHIVMVCVYCYSKFLDPLRPGATKTPQPLTDARSTQIAQVVKPPEWPDYVPFPPTPGIPLPPGFVWDSKGLRKQ